MDAFAGEIFHSQLWPDPLSWSAYRSILGHTPVIRSFSALPAIREKTVPICKKSESFFFPSQQQGTWFVFLRIKENIYLSERLGSFSCLYHDPDIHSVTIKRLFRDGWILLSELYWSVWRPDWWSDWWKTSEWRTADRSFIYRTRNHWKLCYCL